jgi:hypothetical protein
VGTTDEEKPADKKKTDGTLAWVEYGTIKFFLSSRDFTNLLYQDWNNFLA